MISYQFILNSLSSDPTEATQQLKQVIFAKSDPKAPHAKFWKNNEYQL